ncbi:MAG: DUF423 domain-containing protein [Chitinophagaceae bacterium]|nr:DUF423 domain-containing protein [Chitinophagaceae bacterium]
MHKKILVAAAVFAALSVALGAFAAHALKDVLDASQHKTFETAVRYQMYHALAMIFCAQCLKQEPNKTLYYAALFFAVGIVLFSGSLYCLIFLNIINIEGLKFIGAITPLGGLFFIAGWVLIIKSAFNNQFNTSK